MRSMTVAAVVAAGLLVAGAPGPAQAAGPMQGCTSVPASQWLTLDQLKSNVESQGYVVWKGKISNSCAEIAAYPTNTGGLERLFVDPSSGRIVQVR